MKKCLICRKALEGIRRLFCSKACGNVDCERRRRKTALDAKLARLEAAGALDVMCRYCLKDFRPEWGQRGPIPKYCSVRCRTLYYEDRDAVRASRGIGKDCGNCAHATAKGCGVGAFRTCWPGTFAKHWEAREAVSA